MTTLKTLVYGIGFSAALALAGTPALSHANPAAPAAQQLPTEQGSSSMPTETEMLQMRDAAASALEDFRGGDRSYVITGTTIVIILLIILLLIIIL